MDRQRQCATKNSVGRKNRILKSGHANTLQNDRRPDEKSGRGFFGEVFERKFTQTISGDGFNGLRLLWFLFSRSRSLRFTGFP